MSIKNSTQVRRGVCSVMLAAILALVGCSSGDSVDTTTDDASDEQAVEEEVEGDPDVMASMTCETLDTSGHDELYYWFGTFDKAVKVEVGQNEEGTTWWVVMFEWDDEDGVVDLREAYLTDSLEMSDYHEGTWIALKSGHTWRYVDWDHDMLVRGQSALDLARQTLVEMGAQ